MTRSQDGCIQNGGNNCFGPIAGAGYVSVQVITIFLRKIYIFVPVRVIHRTGNCPEKYGKLDFPNLNCLFCCCRFLEELEEGIFIQQTLETLLINADGKQLMVGAVNSIYIYIYIHCIYIYIWNANSQS